MDIQGTFKLFMVFTSWFIEINFDKGFYNRNSDIEYYLIKDYVQFLKMQHNWL